VTYSPHGLSPLPPPVLASVRLVTWFPLFEAHGYPAEIARADARALSPHDVIARVCADPERLPLALARALATIVAFSTEDARRDVYNAADALAYGHHVTLSCDDMTRFG
jgi:hypothetical protein